MKKLSIVITLFIATIVFFACCEMKNHSDLSGFDSSQYTDTECIEKPTSTPTPNVLNSENELLPDKETTGLIETLELYEDSYSTLDELEYKELLSIFSEPFENELIKIARGHEFCKYVIIKMGESDSFNQLTQVREYEGIDISAYRIQDGSYLLIIFADEIYKGCNINRLLNSLWLYENSNDYHQLLKIKKEGGFEQNKSGYNLFTIDFNIEDFI